MSAMLVSVYPRKRLCLSDNVKEVINEMDKKKERKKVVIDNNMYLLDDDEEHEKSDDTEYDVVITKRVPTTQKLRAIQKKMHKQYPNPEKPIFMGTPGKYQIILADPPWFYNNNVSAGNCVKHYPMMRDNELYNFPINDYADPKQCALLMWCTAPKFNIAIELVKRWGFTYKTIFFTWIKVNKEGNVIPGIGNYTKSSTEICIIAVRGSILKWKRNYSIKQVLMERRREHSRKPDEARKRIEEFFLPELRKIELFARQTSPGWDLYGNEINKFDEQTT